MRTHLDRLRAALVDFVEYGSDGATPARALMMRRSRGFGLVAFVIMCVVLALTLPRGQYWLAGAGAVGVVVYGACMRWMSRDGGRYATPAAHVSIAFLMAAIVFASWRVGGATPLSTTFPSLVILGTMYVLGIRAAAIWTGISVACMGALLYGANLPAPQAGSTSDSATVLFASRAVVLVGVFAISALGRRFEDKQTAQLQYLARRDPLTGLYNRRELDHRIDESLARAARYERRPALLFVDLDGFKRVNDERGHAAGDAVLREVASAILSQTRRTDTAGRMGGDEFVVLLEDVADEKTARRYAERLLERLDETGRRMDPPVPIRASVGVAFHPDDGRSTDALCRAADAAMYDAKRAGGSRVTLHGELGRDLR